jgi:hypothetical protein
MFGEIGSLFDLSHGVVQAKPYKNKASATGGCFEFTTMDLTDRAFAVAQRLRLGGDGFEKICKGFCKGLHALIF